MIECVPNFSEGRDRGKIEAIAGAMSAIAGVHVLGFESDADHNRSVLTFAGPPSAVADAAFRAVQKAVELIDLTRHEGAHPRIGAADVVPFIPIEGVTMVQGQSTGDDRVIDSDCRGYRALRQKLFDEFGGCRTDRAGRAATDERRLRIPPTRCEVRLRPPSS